MAVEACYFSAGGWVVCDPMPKAFSGLASATWLSVVAGQHKLCVTDKWDGLICSFNLLVEYMEEL